MASLALCATGREQKCDAQPAAAQRRTVILSAAARYGSAECSAFLQSISRYSPLTHVVLFVDKVRPDMRELTDRLAMPVRFERFSLPERAASGVFHRKPRRARVWSALVDLLPEQSRLRRPLALLAMHPASSRFACYERWLRLHRNEYDQVFCLDVRDVLVLSELSRLEISAATVAEESKRLMDEPVNMAWLATAGYDPYRMFDRRMRKIICSGAIAGPPGELIRLFAALTAALAGRIGNVSNTFGIDQAVLLWLLLDADIEGVQILPFDNPIMMNLGSCEESELAAHLISHERNTPRLPAILHQFDRFPALQEALLSEYLPESG